MLDKATMAVNPSSLDLLLLGILPRQMRTAFIFKQSESQASFALILAVSPTLTAYSDLFAGNL